MAICNCITRHGKSIFSYANERPPIGVFFLFVVSLASSCMILALYFQRSAKIVDHEATEVYRKIFIKLGKIDYCLTEKTTQYNASERQDFLNQHGETSFVNISVPASLSFLSKGNISLLNRNFVTEVTGIIPYYHVLPSDVHVHSVGFHAYLKGPLRIENNKLADEKAIEACVILTVKRDALPNEKLNSLCQAKPLKNNGSSAIHMSTTIMAPTALPSMKKVEIRGLYMTVGFDNRFNPVVNLNILNKGIISERLSTTSCVLFGVVVAMFLYALLRGSTMNSYSKVEQNIS